jgi:hypothetical protein
VSKGTEEITLDEVVRRIESLREDVRVLTVVACAALDAAEDS